jgi:hypothetical protein
MKKFNGKNKGIDDYLIRKFGAYIYVYIYTVDTTCGRSCHSGSLWEVAPRQEIEGRFVSLTLLVASSRRFHDTEEERGTNNCMGKFPTERTTRRKRTPWRWCTVSCMSGRCKEFRRGGRALSTFLTA